MDDSARLRAAVDRAARERPAVPRAPIGQVINLLALKAAEREAARTGQPIDPDAYLERINDPERGDQLLAEREREIRREHLARKVDILLARLPAQYRDAGFPKAKFGLEARRWLDAYRAARAAGTMPPSLVILGDIGSGKTWTACAIARALLLEDMVPTTVTTVAEMLADLRPAVGGLDVDMAQFALAPVLVLDDLGVERPTEWVSEQLYRLAHDRSHNGRPTIVTSNLTGEQIKERYDRRTVERLFGGATLIQIDGDTRRPMPF